jgi:hypothetical protein
MNTDFSPLASSAVQDIIIMCQLPRVYQALTSPNTAQLATDIDTILVPRGAECQAVRRGLGRKAAPYPRILAVPMGYQPLTAYLETWLQSQDFLQQPPVGVLLLGLAGSLSPEYQIGDVTIYQGCTDAATTVASQYRPANPRLTALLEAALMGEASLVKGLTCDRLISSASEKVQLARQYQAGVVDMESAAALAALERVGIPVAIARTISDACQQDLPDLTAAISPEGSLKPLPLGIAMLQRPVAAVQLIRGSLRGLKALESLVRKLY